MKGESHERNRTYYHPNRSRTCPVHPAHLSWRVGSAAREKLLAS